MAGQTETIVNAILTDIDRGILNPGCHIEEQQLITDHAVSRTPVREALIELETMGLVRRIPRKGAEVFRPTLEEFLGILEVHAKLEGQAAGLAARRLSPRHAQRLEETVVACETHADRNGDDDPIGYSQCNIAFHRAIGDAAGNPFLAEVTKTNARKLMAFYRARYRYAGAIAASAREHREIFELIKTRKATEAEALMSSHVQFDHVTALDLVAALG